MTAQTLHLPYKLRAASDGTLTGICVPYGQVSYLTEHAAGERFARGAFAKSIAARAGKIRLKSLHSEVMPVGVATDLEERDDGLYGTFRLYDTPEGHAARQRAQEGVYGGLSIEFRPMAEERAKDGVTEVREAALHAVALELDPAYDGARVLAVRSAEKRAEHAWLWENVPEVHERSADGVDFTRWV
ncbi:HK97 family phage prohead protease [Streptomyces sp. NPDC102340]|uniref:HK97 family phage prohead protease n=1 Tax=unclassified Streptomyces TaxID=2593676 RepID=UPI003821A403